MCCQEFYPWVSGTETIHNIFISSKEDFKFFTSVYQSALSAYVPHKAVTALLPLFWEDANTPAMIHHVTLLVKKQTEYLNSGKFLTLLHYNIIYFLCYNQLRGTFTDVIDWCGHILWKTLVGLRSLGVLSYGPMTCTTQPDHLSRWRLPKSGPGNTAQVPKYMVS